MPYNNPDEKPIVNEVNTVSIALSYPEEGQPAYGLRKYSKTKHINTKPQTFFHNIMNGSFMIYTN